MPMNKELLSALAQYQLAVAAEARGRAAYSGKEWKDYGGAQLIKNIEQASEALMAALGRYVDERVRDALSSRDPAA